MGPKVKKSVKNAFSFFLDDYVAEQIKKGRPVSHKIAAEECGPLWKALPEAEKQRYGQLAGAHKIISKSNKHNKFTTTGKSYAQLEREQEQLKAKVAQADTEIKSTISNLDFDTIRTHVFYIIHCNYYCKTDEGLYVPGELAIVEFNLECGIKRVYHTLINPGKIPLGYAFEARQNCDEIHGLPIPPYDEGESDYCGILQSILKFIEAGKLRNGRYPPLYSIENNIKACENILQTLSDNLSEKNHFRVYLLHKMFFWLKNKCVEFTDQENVGFPVISNAISEIEKDIFCYVPGISCDFHLSSEDKYQNCSLSVVQRFVYVVCDHCCQYVDIQLIPGKHCRKKCDTNRSQTKLLLDQASQRSQSSPPPSEINESDFDGLSSYCGEVNHPDWKSEAGSFLHEELESKFQSLEVSSFRSGSSQQILSSVNASNYNNDGYKLVPFGRSRSHFK